MSEVYLHSIYSLASISLTPLNLTPIRVTGTIVTGRSRSASPRRVSNPQSPAWESDALTRRLADLRYTCTFLLCTILKLTWPYYRNISAISRIVSYYIYIYITFNHLADAFIQSDVQMRRTIEAIRQSREQQYASAMTSLS